MTIRWDSPGIGRDIHDVVEQAIKVAQAADDVVRFEFNGTEIRVCPTHISQIVSEYYAKRGEV